jgi:hypothetical protein
MNLVCVAGTVRRLKMTPDERNSMRRCVNVAAWGFESLHFFAREPEPDFELQDTAGYSKELSGQEPTRKNPNRPPRLRPWILVLLLATVAVGTYFASDPSTLLDLVGLGPPPPGPPQPATPPVTEPADIPTPAPSSPSPLQVPESTSVPTPLFGEGQLVTVRADPASPGGSVALTGDAGGTRPGPSVRIGAPLTVLDAELENNTWIYSVRTEEGMTGWIAERRLTSK